MIFAPHDKIVFIGDSITDVGRRSEPHTPYGRGYVHLARAFLLARYPALDLQVENRGISGNSVRDLAARWEGDVLSEQPAWLSVKIGINDAWRLLANRLKEHVPLDEYERTYRQLLDQAVQRSGTRLILMEPYVIALPVAGVAGVAGTAEQLTGLSLAEAQQCYAKLREQNVTSGDQFDACMVHFRVVMDGYGAVVRQLASDYNAVLVRTQAAFDEVIQSQPPAYWATDRVHPDAPGHAVIARAWLRAVGYGDV